MKPERTLVTRAKQLAAALCVLALAAHAHAEIHEITIQSNYFMPNDLTIRAGDTVRWTLTEPSGGVGCDYYDDVCGGEAGRKHSVMADDGSFTSGPPEASISFEHTFETPGEVRYHCGQHSQPGLDIASNMNGRIVVQAADSGFKINSGLNDAWFNPATTGQGFFINVFPELGQMFVAWFTFDVARPAPTASAQLGEPGHRWITALGEYADDQAVLDVEITRGGVFASANPAPTQGTDGSLTVEFSGCNAGTVTYDIPSLDLQGAIPIQRIALDNLPKCEALAAGGE